MDIREDVPEGVALDILQMAPYFNFDCSISGSNDPQILRDSELVVITAGLPRKPGMSRSDVLESKCSDHRRLDRRHPEICPGCHGAGGLESGRYLDVSGGSQRTGWDRSRIFGQAGMLDASRMASFVAQETGFSALDITTIVLGGHGDTMVPVPRFCTINGIPIAHFISEERIAAIMERTRHGGAEILALRGNSSAYDAPGAAVAAMVDAIVNNRRRLLACVAMLEGEYGETDIAMGVPCVLGERGVESIVELDLNDREREEFKGSVASVRADIERLRSLAP
jgi:malate dehydrogenase